MTAFGRNGRRIIKMIPVTFNMLLIKHIQKSCNIDGPSGTGKSIVLSKRLQTEMDEGNLKYVALAPTNTTARIMNGITIQTGIA